MCVIYIMNSRALEPRNFWGLVKQVGPWKTTSVDQTHLAQGYDSPHNNLQFVTPYQQDGTATIPDQQYTSRTIIDEPSLEYREGRIRKVPKLFTIAGMTVEDTRDNPDRVARPKDNSVAMDVDRNKNPTSLIVDTTNLMQAATATPTQPSKAPWESAASPTMDIDENDSSNVTPQMESNLLTTENPIVQSINQVPTSDKQDFRTGVAQNAWTQPLKQPTTKTRGSKIPIVKRFKDAKKVDVADPATDKFPTRGQFPKVRKPDTSAEETVKSRIHANAGIKVKSNASKVEKSKKFLKSLFVK